MIIVSYHFTYFVYFVSFLSRPFALSIRKFIQTDILIIFSRSEIILKKYGTFVAYTYLRQNNEKTEPS